MPTNAAQAAALTALVPNPFYGVMQSGNISANPTVKTGQLLLPYPQFDDIGVAETDNRDSSYNSLQIEGSEALLRGGANSCHLYAVKTHRRHELGNQLA